MVKCFHSVPRHVFSITRKTDSNSLRKCTFLFSYENWEDVVLKETLNIFSNNFLNTYLRIFYASFPTINPQNSYKEDPSFTTGFRVSCANERKFIEHVETVMIPLIKIITRNIVRFCIRSLYGCIEKDLLFL